MFTTKLPGHKDRNHTRNSSNKVLGLGFIGFIDLRFRVWIVVVVVVVVVVVGGSSRRRNNGNNNKNNRNTSTSNKFLETKAKPANARRKKHGVAISCRTQIPRIPLRNLPSTLELCSGDCHARSQIYPCCYFPELVTFSSRPEVPNGPEVRHDEPERQAIICYFLRYVLGFKL